MGTTSRAICDNLEKESKIVCSQMLIPMPNVRELNATLSLFTDLEASEPDNHPVNRPALLMFNTLSNTLIPTEYDSTKASQWLGKKLRAIYGISL